MPSKISGRPYSRLNQNVPDLPGPPSTRITIPGQHSFVKPLASEPNPAPAPVSLDIRGKIGQTNFQMTTLYAPRYGEPRPYVLQRRRLVRQRDNRSHLQLLHRSRFAAAVRNWHNLTPEEKRAYNYSPSAVRQRIEGLNVWIRKFIAEHDLSEFQLEATLREATPTPTFSGPGP